MQSRTSRPTLESNVCLPICSERHYTSDRSHIAFMATSISSTAVFSLGILSLVFASLTPEKDDPESLAKLGLGLCGAGIAGAIASGVMFFCGTKKNPSSTEEELEKLNSIQASPQNV